MGKEKYIASEFQKLGEAIGVGLISGLVGTAAITISQMIEMKITKRQGSDTPVQAVHKALNIKADEGKEKKFGQEINWVYGTMWGVARGLLAMAGIKRWAATATHFAAVLGTEMIIEPALKVAPPVKKWGIKEILIDATHHAVYAIAAGMTYDAITCNKD